MREVLFSKCLKFESEKWTDELHLGHAATSFFQKWKLLQVKHSTIQLDVPIPKCWFVYRLIQQSVIIWSDQNVAINTNAECSLNEQCQFCEIIPSSLTCNHVAFMDWNRANSIWKWRSEIKVEVMFKIHSLLVTRGKLTEYYLILFQPSCSVKPTWAHMGSICKFPALRNRTAAHK